MKPETEEWLQVAQHDLGAARALLGEGFYQGSVFYCQQAVEKLLKAIWTERRESGTHPRTHNLVKLASALEIEPPGHLAYLLNELTDQVFPSRYPEPGWGYEKSVADEYCRMTEELCEWLRQLLT